VFDVSLPPRYQALAPLGEGGSGQVWAVRDRITGRKVALKMLHEGADEHDVLALVREAVALSGVEGLGVPRVLRFGRLPGSDRSYMVRELVEGDSLANGLARGSMGIELCLQALADAADQVTRLHRARLLHGDLKPANIIVGVDGRATLVDLGLAATWRGDGSATAEGLTPRYAAPELFRGEALTARVEVFALGATLSEVLTSASGSLDPERRRELGELVLRATAEDPSLRHPSADEFASALRRAAQLGEARELAGAAWPIIGVDTPATALLGQIAALPASGVIVVSGPRGSGRSVLLRRVAWSLGVDGTPVAWIETEQAACAREALSIELDGYPDPSQLVLLVDDADALSVEDLATVDAVRQRGGKLVLVTGPDAPPLVSGQAHVFRMTPLDAGAAGELIRRTIPSLSDAVIAHVAALCFGWPGQLRALVARLSGAPVVVPADVDELLTAGGSLSHRHADPRAEIHGLLDRGHVEEAAARLTVYADEQSPSVTIARARVAVSRGDTDRAFAELESVRAEVEQSHDALLRATWLLHVARVHLRTSAYALAETTALEALARLNSRAASVEAQIDDEAIATQRAFAVGQPKPSSRQEATIATQALIVIGSAQSFTMRHAAARATLERSVALARSLEDPRTLSVALGSLAVALQRSDLLAEANAAYEEALSAAEAAGDAGTVATLRLNLAGIAKRRGELAAAITHLEAAVDMGRRSGRTTTVLQSLINLANLDLHVGRLARARASIDALAEQRSELTPALAAQLLALEAEYATRTGDTRLADELCLECASAYERLGRDVDAAEARLERVLLLVVQPNADLAALAEELVHIDRLLGESTAHRAAFALAQAKLATARGDDAQARELLGAAIDAARGSEQHEVAWLALAARAELELRANNAIKAHADKSAALAILEESAAKLPQDLREVYWNDPPRRMLRGSHLRELASGPTLLVAPATLGPDRLARVLEINREIAGEHDLTRLLERVTDHAIALLRAERGFVILRADHGPEALAEDGDGLALGASRNEEGDNPHGRFSRSIADKVISTGEPIVTTSALDDARMASYVSVHLLMLQSIACVPIRGRGGRVIGALYLETRLRPATSFTEEMPTLTAFADQVAIAIETARLVNENEQRRLELATANSALAAASQKLEELLDHRTAQLAATRKDLRSARAVLRGHFGYEGLVGTSAAMRRVYALIDRVKDTDVPVLITGESGTGKEVVARAIHNAGARAKRPFVGINCAAIPEHLLESELFGHVRGAFTGADRDRKGLFREAAEGTILLDEIGEMPPKMQAGLLRVLQERVVRPVGSAREEPVDTRVMTATHRDLAKMVAAGTFREDLYYRLNVIEVRIPPLRERTEDIPVLIDHFLGLFAARYGRERRSVSRSALKQLTAHPWPGNVRQLENALLNAWVLSDRPELEVDDFELPSTTPRAPQRSDPRPAELDVATSLDAHRAGERERILTALSECNWNRLKAAELVGLPRRTFYRRLKEYGIQ
jgi:transcriptional regulator with GAF, ATPase, and Fis domain